MASQSPVNRSSFAAPRSLNLPEIGPQRVLMIASSFECVRLEAN